MIGAITLLVLLPVSDALGQPCIGAVGEWTFDSGSLLDTSGHGNHGVNHGGTFGTGVKGDAFMVNGNSQYAEFGNAPSLNPSNAITLMAWYRHTEPFDGVGNSSIIDKGIGVHVDPYYQYHLGITGDRYVNEPGKFTFAVRTGDVAMGLNSAFHSWVPGPWYFVVGTYDGTHQRLYLNAVLVREQAASGSMVPSDQPMMIGKFTDLDLYARGTIDEVRVFDRAISASEVSLWYIHPDGSPLAMPESSSACTSGGAGISVTQLGLDAPTYQWEVLEAGSCAVGWRDLVDGSINCGSVEAGNTTASTLLLTGLRPSPPIRVRCRVSNACGVRTSNEVRFVVNTADFNNDGDLGTDADIEAFFACLGGTCCQLCGTTDFNGDGDFGTDGDIESFFRVLAGGSC